MRSTFALPALVAVVAAQTFSITTRSSSLADDSQPTSTATVSGPIETAKACGTIARLVSGTKLQNPSVEAELAYSCLKSVPIDTSAASTTITSLKQMVQFQSTISYLKNPPAGYVNEKVDLIAGLDDISAKISNATYTNEFDFETDIASLFVKAHDGHLSFVGMAYGGVVRWRRNRQVVLISGSSDGKQAPKVWAIQDFNQTNNAGFTPSAVTSIDGQDPVQFLAKESLLNAYHDPDARYNAMFYMQPAESFGYFTNPRFYPGPKVSITFENKTTNEYANSAILLSPKSWSGIESGSDFYSQFIVPQDTSSRLKKRNVHTLPQHLQNPREAELERREVPIGYPKPVVTHSAEDVTLAGYFIDGPNGKVGVLVVQTFNTDDAADARGFQQVVQQYIASAKDQKVTKHIFDVRTNGGGKILLGYDLFLQFFPSKKPQLLSRYRGHQGSEFLGENYSSLTKLTSGNAELYTSPFNYHSYLNKDNSAFSSWTNMYPPSKFHDDTFTDLLRYNLSDPYTTSSERYSIGVTMTGYGTRSNFTEDPFKAEDLLILSDGICASTCSLFTELMVQQANVKTLAVGGRPSNGPMQAVGGTKGSLVLSSEYLTAVSSYAIAIFATRTEASQWKTILPQNFGIAAADASINFQDNIRKGLEKDGIPTQFLNDTASCRIYYEPNMYLNVSALWTKAASVAFGKNGGLDEGACVSGSVTSREQQNGQGPGNPTTSGGAADPSSTKKGEAGLARPSGGGWLAVLVFSVVVVGSMGFGANLV